MSKITQFRLLQMINHETTEKAIYTFTLEAKKTCNTAMNHYKLRKPRNRLRNPSKHMFTHVHGDHANRPETHELA